MRSLRLTAATLLFWIVLCGLYREGSLAAVSLFDSAGFDL